MLAGLISTFKGRRLLAAEQLFDLLRPTVEVSFDFLVNFGAFKGNGTFLEFSDVMVSSLLISEFNVSASS